MAVAEIGGLEFFGELTPAYREIFTAEACRFVGELAREFAPRISLAERQLMIGRLQPGQVVERSRPGIEIETIGIEVLPC